ncbi:MAG TPA: pyruvate kinase [Thermotogota bacterium]|nr:pyruvate kinase [Thermotogota bacterium]HPJ87555.1 pyruvate kinase [Thermotogota bacterium]HPR94760.1 pyruvate kinase [Thermotogota bacterium]
MRRTKIVATLGPASREEAMLRKLISAGVNVFRLNTSHEAPEMHMEVVKRIKKLREELQIPLAILLDLEGPKIRTGKLETDTILLEEGQKFTLTSEDIIGNKEICSISYKSLSKDVRHGDIILLYDGLIGLKVLEKDDNNIITTVMNSGYISHHKGVNVPGVDIGLPPLTEKDKIYIKLAVKEGVDYIAQSFVRNPEDIDICREEQKKYKGKIPIIAKIETKQAMQHLRSIIYKADGIMVARGDLGVEIPTEEVPVAQKLIIKMTNEQRKPVITATQMLESMVENPRPTRAEATDIANAIIDGTDAVMLSGETTIGKHPIEAVKVMDKIAEKTEEDLYDLIYNKNTDEHYTEAFINTDEGAVAKSCKEICRLLGINVIVTSTVTGHTARVVSSFKPNANLIGVTPSTETYYTLALVGGVTPVLVPETKNTDEMIEKGVERLLELGLVKRREKILITAGIPWGKAGTTNMIKIHSC